MSYKEVLTKIDLKPKKNKFEDVFVWFIHSSYSETRIKFLEIYEYFQANFFVNCVRFFKVEYDT